MILWMRYDRCWIDRQKKNRSNLATSLFFEVLVLLDAIVLGEPLVELAVAYLVVPCRLYLESMLVAVEAVAQNASRAVEW